MRLLVIAGLVLSVGATGCDKKKAPNKPQPVAAEVAGDKAAEGKATANKAAEGNVAEDKVAADKAAEVKAAEVKAAEVKAVPKTPKVTGVAIKDPAAKANHVDKALAMLAAVGHDAPGFVKDFATDAVALNVGSGMHAQVQGKAQILALQQMRNATSSDTRVKAQRVFDFGETVVIQAVMAGTNDRDMGAMKATGKRFGVTIAFVLSFDDAGQITKVEGYTDESVAMMQLGMIPAMPGMSGKLPEFPAQVEMVKGAVNPKAEALVSAWGKAFNKAEFKGAFNAMATEGFTFVDPNTGLTLAGRDANVKFIEENMFGMFPDWQGSYDGLLSVGDWVIAKGTSSGTYGGGIPGVKAKEDKITTHSLDIYKLDAEGKLAWMQMYANGMEMMGQLGMGPGPGDGAAQGVLTDDELEETLNEMEGIVDDMGKRVEKMEKLLDDAEAATKVGDSALEAAGVAVDGAKAVVKNGAKGTAAAAKDAAAATKDAAAATKDAAAAAKDAAAASKAATDAAAASKAATKKTGDSAAAAAKDAAKAAKLATDDAAKALKKAPTTLKLPGTP